MAVTGADIVNAARELVGIPYRVWRVGDPIPLWSNQYPQGPPPVSWIQARGIDCSDLVSYALQRCGLPAIGGTGDIANSIVDWSKFDASTPGEVGAVAVTAYQGPALADQGHVLLMTGEHTTIQSLFSDGVTEQYTDQETGQMLSLEWYGKLPSVDYGGDSAPVQPDKALWATFGWYEAINAQWDLRWRPPEG